ncbi:hypothetical protein [Bradyrhizobium erythrophlei]|uniref:hypothetical protein n=1 Tax=Bradyrhizobium erythrophlei TaxID=1437360 RepID=UPI00366C1571
MQPKTRIRRHRWLGAALIASAVSGLTVTTCRAQCVELSERAAQVDLNAFAKTPSILLESLRNDKEKLKGRLAAYLVSNPELLPAVRTLISEATSADRTAIGAALRVAESRCITTKPNAARKINAFVQRLQDLAVLTGYSAAGEDQSISPTRVAKQPKGGTGLMTGEFKTDVADPFEPMPLPQ